MLTITREHPVQENLAHLHARHHAAMHADTPPESIHMLPPEALAAPGITFFVLREEGRALGMGALKRLAADHAEIKSMHILEETRGRGLARMMLGHLITEARSLGFARLSLETGSQPSFAPARALYLAAGFTECPPFEGYSLDPMSVYLTRAI
ncbi:GNAT family N-acetyltransferase [Rhodobacter xanthinilyticus]|uniref:GNAT family N-acetyltransferase n=1 Tax=Rhodobacter xanthinilyticus TaxID=1850250 RepID=A0A1D9MAP1_9RHOB|nr:GNAT family N-acetyltransferase [Rhodobacter xanthinilyticus]AOZ68936.1 GNAT family N-acetyltransferase [Rhodobacter xanthinilyticus]